MTPEQERTYKIINTITLMDKKIDLYQMKLDILKEEREKYRQEIVKRFPNLENDKEYQKRL
jgi:hypothetical protein